MTLLKLLSFGPLCDCNSVVDFANQPWDLKLSSKLNAFKKLPWKCNPKNFNIVRYFVGKAIDFFVALIDNLYWILEVYLVKLKVGSSQLCDSF